MSNIMFGVEITVVGLVLLFLSMSLFIVLAEALKRLFRTNNETASKSQEEKTTAMAEGVSDEESAAAIAAVLAAYTEQKDQLENRNELT